MDVPREGGEGGGEAGADGGEALPPVLRHPLAVDQPLLQAREGDVDGEAADLRRVAHDGHQVGGSAAGVGVGRRPELFGKMGTKVWTASLIFLFFFGGASLICSVADFGLREASGPAWVSSTYVDGLLLGRPADKIPVRVDGTRGEGRVPPVSETETEENPKK